MSQNLICPLWSIQRVEPCERSSCAWYDTESECCSVVVIARELKNFNLSIEDDMDLEVEKC